MNTVNPYCLGVGSLPKKTSSSGLYSIFRMGIPSNLQAFMSATIARKGHNPVFRARQVPLPLFFQQKNRKTEKRNHDQSNPMMNDESFRKVLGNESSNETTPFFLINTIKNRGLSIAMLPYAGSCSHQTWCEQLIFMTSSCPHLPPAIDRFANAAF